MNKCPYQNMSLDFSYGHVFNFHIQEITEAARKCMATGFSYIFATKIQNAKSGNPANPSRSHIESEHSSGMSVCGVCGQRFALPQDLGAHVRGGGCEGGRVSRKMGKDTVSRKMGEEIVSRKIGEEGASRKMEIESISRKMGEESISRKFAEESTSRKIAKESTPLKMEVSVKVEEGHEILGMACTEEGCEFEADTFNMLLFHQGWCSSFKALLSLI